MYELNNKEWCNKENVLEIGRLIPRRTRPRDIERKELYWSFVSFSMTEPGENS